MATYVSGQGGCITFNSTTLPVESWTLNINAEALDVTTCDSSGWNENILGIKGAEGSAKAYWDSAAMPVVSPLSMTAGARATLVLKIGNTAKQFSFTAQITQVSVESAAKGVVAFNVNFVGSGAVTYPS